MSKSKPRACVGNTRLLARFFVCLAVLLWGAGVYAAETTFTITTSGSTRSISVESVYIQGIPHVPLASLTQKAGGDCRERQTQVQVDFRGSTALADIDGVRIYSSRKAFSLRHPIVRQNDVIYIELLDAQTFFREAFEVTLAPALASRPQATTEPPDPPGRETEPARPGPTGADFERFEPMPSAVAPEPVPLATELIEPLEDFAKRDDGKTHFVIDAGHGGRDGGNAGERGTLEKSISLKLALALQDALRGEDKIAVHLTREEDKDATIKARAAFANAQQGTVLISLHAAASPSSAAHGIGLYYPPDRSAVDAVLGGLRRGDSMRRLEEEKRRSAESRRYAEAIAEGLGAQVSSEKLALHAIPLRLSAPAMMPVVLIEAGFLSNPAEEALLATDAYIEKLAAGIASGLKSAAARRAGV